MAGHVHLLVDGYPQFGNYRFDASDQGPPVAGATGEFPWLRSRLLSLWTDSYFVATLGGGGYR